MNSGSPWYASFDRFPKLSQNREFDVAIIGGGITGITAALLLKQSGKRVCVLERDRLGTGDTGVTTAHLTYQTDLCVSELVETFGEEAGALTLRAGQAAINLIESNVLQWRLDCDFQRVPGYLHAAWNGTEDERPALVRDVEVAQGLGYPVRFLESVPYCGRPGICFPDQAKFDPLRYIEALAHLVDGDGSCVFEESEVSAVENEPFHLSVGKLRVQADYLIVATHVPLMGASGFIKATLLQTKIYPYSSYVIGAKIAKGVLPEAVFWDTSDPYYYLRIDAGKEEDYVIFGGEDHKTGQETNTDARYRALQSKMKEIVPAANPDRRWSGQVIETNDGLPYIGEIAPRQFVATGFGGNGMTFGTLAAMMACDRVLEQKNPWSDLFAVERKNIRGGAWDYLVENVDYPYYFVKDRLRRPLGNSIDEVEKGDGQVLTIDGRHVACSRDMQGNLTTLSACCTHLGCLVRWNSAEQTWDCPCHGSRFSANGDVIAGPAEAPLVSVALASSAGTR